MNTRLTFLTIAICACLLAVVPPALARTGSAPPSDNLLQNPGAEAGASGHGNLVGVPGWSLTGSFTVDDYGDTDRLSKDISTAYSGGNNYFFGGPGKPLSTATQTVDLTAYADQIDKGALDIVFGADVGGYAAQTDKMDVQADILSASGVTLKTYTVAGLTAEQRGNKTTMRGELYWAALPVGARSIRVTMTATRYDAFNNDGYADNLSLFLRERAPAPTGHILAALQRELASSFLKALPTADAAAAVATLQPGVALHILSFSPVDSAKIVAALSPAGAAKILRAQPPDGAKILAALPFNAALKILQLQPPDGVRTALLKAMPAQLAGRFRARLGH